jgi:hypothetical protein
LRNGDRPTGKQTARHLEGVFATVPKSAETMYARADSGFYCAEAVEAYEKAGARFIVSARKTSRLIEELKAAQWTGSPKTDADGQCEFRYQPEGWSTAHRFIALRYIKKKQAPSAEKPEQYQLFDTPNTAIAFLSPISTAESLYWHGSIISARARRTSSRKRKMMPV